MLKLTAFYRYSSTSWEFCSAILCAAVIDDISSGRFLSRKRFILGLALAFSVVGISLYPAWGLVRDLYVQSGYRPFLWASLSWGFGSMVIAAACFKLAKDYHLLARRAMAALLVIDAVALFSVSLFSGVTGASSLSAGVTYLKKHIGTGRFYTLGPISPNYGAYYQIASINHNYLPIAKSWVNYIKNHLDPYSDPVCFTGDFSRTDTHFPTQRDVLVNAISEYEEVGVRYVVTSHSEEPLQQKFGFHVMNSGSRPLILANGQSVSGEISERQFSGKRARFIEVLIGNYNGKSPMHVEGHLHRVFESSDMDIYELTGAKPYFDVVQGRGNLDAENRSVVSVSCASDAQLIRRELYYPGWRASGNGRTFKIERYNDIFQSVKIPPGKYKITFNYTPTHSWRVFCSECFA